MVISKTIFESHLLAAILLSGIFDTQYPITNRAYTCTGNAEHSEVEQSQVLPILPNALRMVISKTNFESHLLAAILLSGIFDTQYQISK